MEMTRTNSMLSRARSLAIVAMLLAALVLIGVLGWQTWRLQQSNSATAATTSWWRGLQTSRIRHTRKYKRPFH